MNLNKIFFCKHGHTKYLNNPRIFVTIQQPWFEILLKFDFLLNSKNMVLGWSAYCTAKRKWAFSPTIRNVDTRRKQKYTKTHLLRFYRQKGYFPVRAPSNSIIKSIIFGWFLINFLILFIKMATFFVFCGYLRYVL